MKTPPVLVIREVFFVLCLQQNRGLEEGNHLGEDTSQGADKSGYRGVVLLD